MLIHIQQEPEVREVKWPVSSSLGCRSQPRTAPPPATGGRTPGDAPRLRGELQPPARPLLDRPDAPRRCGAGGGRSPGPWTWNGHHPIWLMNFTIDAEGNRPQQMFLLWEPADLSGRSLPLQGDQTGPLLCVVIGALHNFIKLLILETEFIFCKGVLCSL